MNLPKNESTKGKTPVIVDHQARAVLAAPDASKLRGLRDSAVLATLLYHGLRRAELCALHLVDLQERRGLRSLRIRGRAGRFVRCGCTWRQPARSRSTWKRPAMAPTRQRRCFSQSATTTVDSTGRSRQWRVSDAAQVRRRRRHRDRRLWPARAALYGRHQCTRTPRGYRQGAGLAGTRKHRDHAPV